MIAEPLTFPMPAAGLSPCTLDTANALIEEWGHNLGPCRRPFGSDPWVLQVGPIAVSVIIAASAVSRSVTCAHGITYERRQIVEVARMCTDPTRPMLRLWREVAGPQWPYWRPDVAIAYSQNDRHDGRTYRFDGWERCSVTAGSSGGGTWSSKRTAEDEVHGQKSLWLWHYDDPGEPQERAT